MMNPEIKKYADNGDLKSLKYAFVDALDVDPTFVKYEEDYNYCKSISSLLEEHVELTPFTDDEVKWTDSYWASLKMDLVKNFSDERMSHMRKVAKVFMADKVQRILAERASAAAKPQAADHIPVKEPIDNNAPVVGTQPEQKSTEVKNDHVVSKAEQQEREKETLRKEIEAHNKAIMAEQERKAKERAKQQRQLQEATSSQPGDGISKKAIGIAVAVAVAAVVLIMLLK